MTRVDVVRIIDLTDKDFTRCRQLTYRADGWMEEEAVARRNEEQSSQPYRYTQVVLVYEDDLIVGWCLLQPAPRRSRYKAYFFVDPLHRGRGYGKLLFERARQYGRWALMVYPDGSNIQFFERFKYQWTDLRENASV